MIAQNLLDKNIKFLSPSDTVRTALEKMDEQDVEALPVSGEEGEKLLGLVRKETLQEIEDPTTTLENLDWEKTPHVNERQHLFEAARQMYHFNVWLVPVVDDDNHIKGLINKKSLQSAVGEMLNLGEYGSVITVEMVEKDYTLSEVVQLIETEGAKILGLTVETPSEHTDYYRISLKLNVKDVSRVVSALRRYDYLVTSETWDDVFDSDMQERAGEVIHFLDM